MDFGLRFVELKKDIQRLSEKADALAQSYAEAEDFTSKFLTQCSKHRIKLVSINKKTDLIEGCRTWPFGYDGSVFADGRTKDGWPTIWSVVEELGISGGCGNSGQHKITDSARLVDGVYRFENGKWIKIE
jgi:hypothetical protein